MKTFLCFVIALFIGLFVSFSDTYAQCPCWLNGIESELINGSRGTICEQEGNTLRLRSLSNPNDFCDNEAILEATEGSCSDFIGPINPNPPPGQSCGPGAQSMGEDPENVCLQELEDFCEAVTTKNVPTISEWGLIAMAGLLGIVGFMVVRRRQLSA